MRLLSASLFLLLAGLPVYGQAFSCTASVASQPTVRARGRAEVVGDVILDCNGLRPSGGLTADSITVTLNVPLTSRILNPSLNASEALMLLESPPPDQQIGQALGSPPSNLANVLQGRQVGPNAVEWNAVPLAGQGPVGSVQRSVRITNLRANVASLPVGGVVSATVTIGSQSTIALNNGVQNVASVGSPLTFSARTPDDLATFSQQISGCTGKPLTVTGDTPRDFNVRFSEGFLSEFRRRNVATSANNPQALGDQNNILGQLGFGTETGFFNSSFPATSSMNQAGLATQGTRLMSRFTGLPAGAQVWVTVQPVIQGSSNTGITARLTQANASGGGAFSSVGPTAGIYAQLPVQDGTATAVWEVFDANQTVQESLAFGVIVSIPANTLSSAIISVAGSYAPHETAATSVPGVPIPNFSGTELTSTPIYDIRGCVPTLTLSIACPLPPATIGLAYSVPLGAAGGVPPYRWNISAGTLPAGLNISTTGLISGTATQAGVFNFTIRVADNGGASASQECSMAVQAGVSITSACPLPDTAVGVAYSHLLAAGGGTPPYAWTIIRGALPSGLQVNRTLGAVTGTTLSPGVFNFTLQASDSRGSLGQKDCSLRVVASLRLSSNTLSFRAPSGAPRATTQLVHITSETPGQAWTVRTTGGDWLRATPAGGSAPGLVEISTNPAGMAEGSYSGLVTITTQGAIQQSSTVSVDFAVDPPTPSETLAQPSTLMLSIPRGTVREERVVQITRRGPGATGFTAQVETETGGGWVTLPAAIGEATAQSPGRVRIVFQPSALPAGTYHARLLLDITGGPRIVVPVVMGVTNTREAITVSPSVVHMQAVAGSGVTPPKTVAVALNGPGAVNWQASVLADPGQSRWLTATPTGSRVNPGGISNLELRANTAGLDPGRYAAELLVSAPGVDNSPRLVLVTLEVLPSATVVFSDTAGFAFSGTPGSAVLPAQFVTLHNAGRTAVNFDFDLAGDAAIWSVTTQGDRVIPAGGSARLDVSANPTRLTGGVFSAQLNVQVSGDPLVRSIDLRLLLGARPVGSPTACPPGGLEVVSQRTSPGFTVLAGSMLPVDILVSDATGAPHTRGVVTASLSGSNSLATLVHLADGRWSGIVRAPLEAGPASLHILAEDRDRGVAGCLDIPGAVEPAAPPILAEGGVLSTASFQVGAPVAPGAMVAIFGARLAEGVTSSLALPLPQLLGVTRARIGNSRLPLFFAGDLRDYSQVNGILPYGLTPNVLNQLHVQAAGGIAVADVFVTEAQPAVFTVNQRGTGQAIAVHGVNPLLIADAANPIARGQVVVVYCEGLGPVTPPIEAGRAVPSDPLSRAALPVRLTIGGQPAEVQFAGLTPGLTGLYQINAVVPTSVAPGNEVPLVVTVNGQSSPVVTLAVRP
jgi:uncharacterized protein (TIGR03437 family)